MTAHFLDPLSGDYSYIPGCEAYFTLTGETAPINLGYIDAAELEIAVEEAEKKGLVNGVRTTIRKDVTQTSANIKLTLASMTDFNRGLSLMSTAETQGADETFTLGDKVIQLKAGGHKSGIANNTSIRGQLTLLGVNKVGDKPIVVLWDVELRPGAARSLTGEDFGSVEVSGTAYPVSGKAAGYELGMEGTHTGVITDAP
ncbi:hypothetical protein U5903_04210 [Cereibacter johrii]|uniref:hypothetical protein n=1 Tax=Cereibacter johrii TaxID=445629 RepID=UPI002B25FA94|nr:hypothetical protein [Cereibacter johrii]MEA5159972.1 hypothetical protein [Cereibacter johrii]